MFANKTNDSLDAMISSKNDNKKNAFYAGLCVPDVDKDPHGS